MKPNSALDPALEVRVSILAQLRALSDEGIHEKSARVLLNFQANFSKTSKLSLTRKKIALYQSLRYEVQLSKFAEHLSQFGAELCYPEITDAENAQMRFIKDGTSDHVISAPEIDIFIVPGLAFGRSGERIGRGKGFYDRFLSQNTRALRLAFGFDFQLFPALQQNPWDQRVHQIVTETDWVVVE